MQITKGLKSVIAQTQIPITQSRIVLDLKALGISAGDTLLVHSSLSASGWIIGGAVTEIEALLEVLKEEGTLMMPTHSADNTEPSR